MTALAGCGTRVIFGLPGGGPNLDVVGAAATAGLRFVLAHSESAATIMAATYADLTGTPGAVLVTRGPGLASAVNGIAHAALDRLPVIVIADTIRSAEADRISHQRLDLTALGQAVAKAVVTVWREPSRRCAARSLIRYSPAAMYLVYPIPGPGRLAERGTQDGVRPYLPGRRRGVRRPPARGGRHGQGGRRRVGAGARAHGCARGCTGRPRYLGAPAARAWP